MPYLLLLFLCLATVVAYVQRSALSVPSKAIEAEFGLDDGGLGLVGGRQQRRQDLGERGGRRSGGFGGLDSLAGGAEAAQADCTKR